MFKNKAFFGHEGVFRQQIKARTPILSANLSYTPPRKRTSSYHVRKLLKLHQDIILFSVVLLNINFVCFGSYFYP